MMMIPKRNSLHDECYCMMELRHDDTNLIRTVVSIEFVLVNDFINRADFACVKDFVTSAKNRNRANN